MFPFSTENLCICSAQWDAASSQFLKTKNYTPHFQGQIKRNWKPNKIGETPPPQTTATMTAILLHCPFPRSPDAVYITGIGDGFLSIPLSRGLTRSPCMKIHLSSPRSWKVPALYIPALQPLYSPFCSVDFCFSTRWIVAKNRRYAKIWTKYNYVVDWIVSRLFVWIKSISLVGSKLTTGWSNVPYLDRICKMFLA